MDLNGFLTPLADPAPSGEDLRNDPQFDAIQRMLEPASRAARLADGNTLNANVAWDEVLDAAGTLAARGRDLRLLVVVTRALANTESFQGLTDGLGMLARTVEDYWDSVHPALRESADAREAALRRINALKQLENAEDGLLCDLLMNAVLTPRGIGAVSGADLAAGLMTEFEVLNEAPSGLGEKEKAEILAKHEARANRVKAATRALAAEEAERAGELAAAMTAAEATARALEATFNTTAGLAGGPGLTLAELVKHLSRMRATLEAALAEAAGGGMVAAAQPVPAAPAAGAPAPASGNGAAPSGGGFSGAINSRADVERALDQIIAFYERTEPSSPIPHLARRMRRMVPMDFMQLMAEIAPSGMKEFRAVAGVGDKNQ